MTESLIESRLSAIAMRDLGDRTISPGDAHALLDLIEGAREFVRTTTIFRQRKVSRDAFERLAVALIELGAFSERDV